MMKSRELDKKIILLVLVLLLIFVGIFSIVFGSVHIPLTDVVNAILGGDSTSKNTVIVLSVRLPRTLGAIFAGAALGVAGVILQSVMNNSLASPNTIGVNSGAGFFAMLSMILFPHSIILKSVMAFIGALITSILILLLAYLAEKSRVTIVLAGITVSSFLSAGMNMMKILDPDINVNALQFLVGSLSGVKMQSLIYPTVGIAIALVISIMLAKALNILALGDGVAISIGFKVNFYRGVFVILASVLAGLVVSYCGLIGFVGLIVPHVARFLFGNDAKVLMPVSMIMGALFVLLADLIGRIFVAPYEVPVGIVLSLFGCPFFLYLLMKKGGSRVNA